MSRNRRTVLRRALRIEQRPGHPLYLMCLTGEELLQVADISRVSRDDAGKLIGYQRAEVRRHVEDIVQYLNNPDVIFPNSIILALSSRVKFSASRGPQVNDGLAVAGLLEIPLGADSAPKPAWIVDGQQRALAISRSKRRDLPIPVNAFVADDVELQRDQFLRVNNTRPLPRGLITELLPEVSSPLPANLEARKLPSAICELLNTHDESPFKGLIKRASTNDEKKRAAVVTDTSVVKMIQDSLRAGGCLFTYRNFATNEVDTEAIWRVLILYWTAVKKVFPDAWGKPPTRSRLMHGAGLRAMGRVMDKVMGTLDVRHPRAQHEVLTAVSTLQPECRWTGGVWEELGGIRWDEIQNVPRHIGMLSNFLVRRYVQHRSSR